MKICKFNLLISLISSSRSTHIVAFLMETVLCLLMLKSLEGWALQLEKMQVLMPHVLKEHFTKSTLTAIFYVWVDSLFLQMRFCFSLKIPGNKFILKFKFIVILDLILSILLLIKGQLQSQIRFHRAMSS